MHKALGSILGTAIKKKIQRDIGALFYACGTAHILQSDLLGIKLSQTQEMISYVFTSLIINKNAVVCSL
jgi:hypothetical protein